MKSLLALGLIVVLAAFGCGVNEGPIGTPAGGMGLASCQTPSALGGQGGSESDGGVREGDGNRARVSNGGSGAIELPKSEPHDAVTLRKNCEKLQAAVEEFAAHYGGRYPGDVDSERSLEGKTVLEYLPGDGTLYNAYSDVWETPVAHTAGIPGEIGYVLMDETRTYDGRNVPLAPAYVITGFGEWSVEVALSNLELSLVEAVVFSNCRTMQMAIEKWSTLRRGLYPSDVDCDATPGGETVVDLLPRGCYMLNPATGALSEPVNAWAAVPGESGLVPVCINGRNQGYVITGVGSEAGREIIVITYNPELDR